MDVGLSTVKAGMKVKLRDERILTVISIEKIRDKEFPFDVLFDNGEEYSFTISGAYWSDEKEHSCDIVEILPSEEPKEETCLWSYDRDVPDHPDMPIWKTSCGHEFDRLKGCEQPRKHLRMEYCPYCGKHIADATTDC